MNKYKSEASINVSTQISRYILNKAKDLYINRLRSEAIQQRSLEINKQYPTQCTLKIIELTKFAPSEFSPKLNQDFQLNPPAKCRDINGSSVKTTCASSPRMSTKTYGNCRSTLRNQKKDSSTVILTHRTFLPLISSQEEDQQIQVLRQKKQKIEILEKFFDESQKKQKSKLKQKITETINNNFTTDFNGDKLEIKSTKRKKTVDPYIMIEMEANLSEERSENRLNLKEGRNMGRIKKTTKLSDINNIYRQELSKGRASKISKNIEGLQLRQIENILNREDHKRSYCLNRISRLKIMPEMMSINLIK